MTDGCPPAAGVNLDRPVAAEPKTPFCALSEALQGQVIRRVSEETQATTWPSINVSFIQLYFRGASLYYQAFSSHSLSYTHTYIYTTALQIYIIIHIFTYIHSTRLSDIL